MFLPLRYFYFFFLMIPPPPRSTLFPYTTLFRSRRPVTADEARTVERKHHRQALQRHVVNQLIVGDRKSTRLNSSHEWISYAVFCLKKKKKQKKKQHRQKQQQHKLTQHDRQVTKG